SIALPQSTSSALTMSGKAKRVRAAHRPLLRGWIAPELDSASGDPLDGRHAGRNRGRSRRAPLSPPPRSTARRLLSPRRPSFSQESAFPKPPRLAERYPGALQGASDCSNCLIGHLPPRFLEIDHRREAQVGPLCKIRLRDVQ